MTNAEQRYLPSWPGVHRQCSFLPEASLPQQVPRCAKCLLNQRGEQWVLHLKLITNSNFNSFLKHMPSVATRWRCCLVYWRALLVLDFVKRPLRQVFLSSYVIPPALHCFILFIHIPQTFFSPLLHRDVVSTGPSSLSGRRRRVSPPRNCTLV